MRSPIAGRSIRRPFAAMIAEARMAAQSSADSQPGPPQRAMEMPMKAAAEVMASLR